MMYSFALHHQTCKDMPSFAHKSLMQLMNFSESKFLFPSDRQIVFFIWPSWCHEALKWLPWCACLLYNPTTLFWTCQGKYKDNFVTLLNQNRQETNTPRTDIKDNLFKLLTFPTYIDLESASIFSSWEGKEAEKNRKHLSLTIFKGKSLKDIH